MSSRLWRLTRNRYGRELYDALDAAGVKASLMIEYRRRVSEPEEPAIDGVAFRIRDPGALGSDFRDAGALDRADAVVCARAGGDRVGSLLLTVDREVHVDVLDRPFDPRGVYVWRVYVDPDHRRRGIGTGLIRAGLGVAARRGTDAASALVARDNLPSKRAFERVGFRPARELQYLSVFGAAWRRTVDR
ncbi:MAG: GNAT family N-acetyltransferase [Salinirussus sp.]